MLGRVVENDARKVEEFHGVLHDVAHGVASDRVRSFFIQAYHS